MRMTIARDALAGAAQAASKVASRASTPAMASALIDAGPDGAAMAATDGDQSVSVELEGAVVDEPGRALVGAAALARIAKSLPDGPVEVESSGGRAGISGGRSRFGVPALDPSEWAAPPGAEGGSPCAVDADVFADAVRRVSPFCARDAARAALDGVHMVFDGSALRLEAADSYRMAVATIPAEGGDRFNAIAYPWFLSNASGWASGSADLSSDGRAVSVSSGGMSAAIRAIGRQFPDLRMFYPGTPAYTLEFGRAEMSAALARALAVGNDKPHVEISASGGSMSIRIAGDKGDFAEDIACDGEFSFCASAEMLKSCVDAVDSDAVRADGDEGKPFTMLHGERAMAGLMHVRRVG